MAFDTTHFSLEPEPAQDFGCGWSFSALMSRLILQDGSEASSEALDPEVPAQTTPAQVVSG